MIGLFFILLFGRYREKNLNNLLVYVDIWLVCSLLLLELNFRWFGKMCYGGLLILCLLFFSI